MYSWIYDELRAALEKVRYFESFTYNCLIPKTKKVKRKVFKGKSDLIETEIV